MSRDTLNATIAHLAASALLWAPVLLALLGLAPPEGTWRLHAITAGVLAFILARILAILFAVPVAEAAPGRYRVLPASPSRPMLTATIGVTCVAWSLLRVERITELSALLGCFCGGVSLAMALRLRADPIWGTWMEIGGDVLRVHASEERGFSVPLGQAREIRLRPSDRSFVLVTPWEDRDLFVPSARSRSRFRVSDHERLFSELARRVPVHETAELLPARRRRRSAEHEEP